MKYKELEFKYRADHIGLVDPTNLFESMEYKKKIEVGSWDYYYTHPKDLEKFVRDRKGTNNAHRELTTKRQTDENNNNDRDEVNVDNRSDIQEYNKFMELIGAPSKKIKLDPDHPMTVKFDLDEILRTVKEDQDFWFNFKVYKICWIYWLKNNVVAVYYVTFDEDFRESGRFVELEADPRHEWASKEEAWDAVLSVEKELGKLNITPQNRMRNSLYQLFRSDKRKEKK